MTKKLHRLIKRLKFKFYIKLINTSIAPSVQEDVTPYEKDCFKICLKMINHIDSEFMIAPVSNKKYIRNDSVNIFITFYDNRVELTDHEYHYEVKLSPRNWSRLNFIYDRETEKRIIKMENRVNSQIKNSLHDVLNRISDFGHDSISQIFD